MSSGFILRLRPSGAVVASGDNGVHLQLGDSVLSLAVVPASVRTALAGLADGASDDELSRVADDGTGASLALWYYCLEVLQRNGCLTCEVMDAGRPLARATATREFQPGRGVVVETCEWVLSRFTYLQCAESGLVMKSARSSACVELLDPRVVYLTTTLARPHTVAEAIAQRDDLSPTLTRDFLGLLEYSGMLTRVEHGARLEDASPLATWDFIDLLFHTQSRAFARPRREAASTLSLPPAVKPPVFGRTVDLHVPDVALLERSDVPFARVLERRRSVREHGNPPIGLEQIGEFLYRAARVKRVFRVTEEDGGYELTERPYPGAGACYELETYLVVTRCDGLPAGLYHYDPLHHRLESVVCDPANLARLSREASLAAGSDGERQVLVVLAARFARLAAKYGPGSYALILKDAGVLLQTMSLVAAAMGLGSCILGSGNSTLFARAVGMNAHEETSVAELLLGTPAPNGGVEPNRV